MPAPSPAPAPGLGVDVSHFLQHVPALLWVAGEDGLLRWANQPWHAYVGQPIEDARAAGWAGVIHAEDRGRMFASWAAARASGDGYEIELRIRHGASSAYRWFLVRGQRVAGDETLWYGSCTDIHERRLAEAHAADSERRWLTLASELPQMVWTADASGRVTWVNRHWTEYTGQVVDDMDDDGWKHVLHPDDLAQTAAAWRHSLASGEPYDIQHRWRRAADGGYRWFIGRALPRRDPDGRIVEWMGTTTDIEDSRRLLAEAETLNRIGLALAGDLELERIVQAVTDGGRELVEASFGAFFYNVIDDAGGRYTLYTLSGVPREAFARFPMPRATALFGPTFRGEGVIRSDDITKDPRYGLSGPHHGMPPGHLPVRSYLAVSVRSRSGEVIGGLFYGHAQTGRFTERHERLLVGLGAQAAISIDNSRLLDSERLRASQLSNVNAELQHFAYIASHDMQEPLRTVTQYLDLLELRYAPQLDERARSYIAQAVGSASRMHALIDDLLSYTRLATASTATGPTPLAELVDEARHDLQALIASTGATIEAGELPTVDVDRSRFRLLLQNLISNALKFRGEQPPRVRVTAGRSGDAWTVTIADNGIGVAPEHHQRIFEIFQRLHRDDQVPGTGIGLAICKRIVEQRGGRISLRSSPGEGAEFSFTVPDGRGQAASP